jgi:hypothetical protein
MSANPANPPRLGLVVGHTTHESTTIWVRGDERFQRARISLTGLGGSTSDVLPLRSSADYTTAWSFRGLSPATRYRVVAGFSSSPGWSGDGVLELHGRLSTFPAPTAPAPFCFLLGSCNLPTPRITSLLQLGAGFLGTSAVRQSLGRPVDDWYWPTPAWLRRVLQWGMPRVAGLLLGGVMQATRFQLPQPDLPSPFRALRDQLWSEPPQAPAFMIHAGDQIYFDIDIPQRASTVEEYRSAYRQAWLEDDDVHEFLASLPHYMILDDHEIIDNFDNDDPGETNGARLESALVAYREWVHQRQPGGERPGGPLYYEFQYGTAFFFVLDARSTRHRDRQEMISSSQMTRLLAWLGEHAKDLKFVVSSVPFVAQLRPDATPPKPGARQEREDKWCGDAFRRQRDEIIDTIYSEEIERVVFLVGDMHCAYHATMNVGPPAGRVVIHELAGGPINQVDFPNRAQFYDRFPDVTTVGQLPFTSFLRSFQTATSSVTRVSVDPAASPMLRWEIVRTERRVPAKGAEPRPLGGWIGFERS